MGDPLAVLAWPGSAEGKGNPYIDLLYEAMPSDVVRITPFTRRALVEQRWDIIHIHWPEWGVRIDSRWHFVRDLVVFLGLLKLARLRGASLVWTAHDLRPHDAGDARSSFFFRAYVRQVDHVVALSQTSLGQVHETYRPLRSTPSAVIPHGHYRDAYPAFEGSKEAARCLLGLSEQGRLLVLFGQLRPYKNATGLIGAFRRRAGSSDRLLIVGEPIDGDTGRDITLAAGGDPRITLSLRHVGDEAVGRVMAAADVVVLPYHHILNSGAALLALSFDRPVLAPGQGSLSDLQGDVGDGWLQLFDGRFTDDDLEAALHMPLPAPRAPVGQFDWPSIAAETVSVYRRSAASKRGGRRRCLS